jgi:hypothetical protein
MLKTNVVLATRAPGYEVRVIVSIVKTGAITTEDQLKLKEVRKKLEQSIPGNIRVRYNMNMEQLILISKTKDLLGGQRLGVKLSGFVRTAAITLQYSIQ